MAVEEQTEQDAERRMYSGSWQREGQKLTITNRVVSKLAFILNRESSTEDSNVTLTIRKVSDGSLIVSKVWGLQSALPLTPTWEEVEFDTPPTIDEEVRIGVEFPYGSSLKVVAIRTKLSDVKGGEYHCEAPDSEYTERTTWDCAYRYTYGEPGPTLPTLTIQAMTDILPISAKAHGNVTDLGSPNPTQHGHCWSTSPNPTISDPHTELGSKDTTGAFDSDLTGLLRSTPYYVKAYATNEAGTAYSTELSFTTSTEFLRPNAPGDQCAMPWEVGDACPDHWKNVDEVEPDEDTTQVYSGSSPGYTYDVYNLPAHSLGEGKIDKINVWARFKRGATADPRVSADIIIKTGETLYDSAGSFDPTVANPWHPSGAEIVTEDWANYSTTWTTNPNTGNPWTWAEIDALQIGIALRTAQPPGVEPRTACTQLWVEVLYSLVAPTVTSNPATAVEATIATPNGNLDDDGGEACDCGFEWGETIAYGNTTPTQSRTTGQTFSQGLSGLDPATTYHFRAFATNAIGTSYGADRTFTTLADPTTTTNPATSLEKTAATLNGTLDDDGNEACDCGFEYGETTAYGTTTPTESKETGETFSQLISDLTPGKHYHFRAIATNSAGTSYGSDRQFFAKLKGGNPNIDQTIFQHVERMD